MLGYTHGPISYSKPSCIILPELVGGDEPRAVPVVDPEGLLQLSLHRLLVRLLHQELGAQLYLRENIAVRYTAVSSEAWAKSRDWANVAARGRLLLSGSVAHVSLKIAVSHKIVF